MSSLLEQMETRVFNCSDPQKLDTKVPVLILTRVLAGEPTSLPRGVVNFADTCGFFYA